jgi:hypothetical protein
MAAEVRAIVLDEGKQLVSGALVGTHTFGAFYFRLGTAYNFTPDGTATDVTGGFWDSTANLVQTKNVSPGVTRYTMTIPEGVGPLEFGNIMLFANRSDGVKLPYLHIILPFPVRKEASSISSAGLTAEDVYPRPGDRVVITATVVQRIMDESTPVTVTVTAPSYAGLPLFDDETLVPPAATVSWEQFVIAEHTATGTPTIVAKRQSDDTYWAIPFFQDLKDPSFGTIDGGRAGEGYQPGVYTWVWGHRYMTDDADYSGQVGGFGYLTLNPNAPIIGGMSY